MIASFLLGLAGSLHCIGMCGPLAAAVSGGRNLLYNAGRIFTYGVLGSLVSLVGMGLSFAGVQNWVSIAIGVSMLFFGITRIHVAVPSFMAKFVVLIRGRFRLNPVFSGMVNGLLPCGMTLIALGYCVTVKGPLEGFMAMVSFGLGTLPAMLGFSFIARSLMQKLPNVQTALMIVAGILLIGRAVQVTTHEEHTDIVVCGATLPRSTE